MVIPVADSNPVRRIPVVTWTIAAANVVVFILSPLASGVLGGTSPGQFCRQAAYLNEYGAIPREITRNEPLAVAPGPAVQRDGRVGCLAVPPDYDKQPALSVLTAMFVHGGWLHLLGNLLYLLIFGNNVEDRMGRLRFMLFYLACGYAATYGFALLDAGSRTPLVGASGAIAGVLGAYLVMFPRARVWSLVPFLFFIPLRIPAWLVLGGWFLIQYVYFEGAGVAASADVAYGAHVIGFVLGLVLALTVARGSQPPPAEQRYGYGPAPPLPPSRG